MAKRQFFKQGRVAALNKPRQIRVFGNWDAHTDAVRPQIRELDRIAAQSLADAHRIVVSNARKL